MKKIITLILTLFIFTNNVMFINGLPFEGDISNIGILDNKDENQSEEIIIEESILENSNIEEKNIEEELSVVNNNISNLPTIVINTDNGLPIDSKEEYRTGTMKIIGNEQYSTGLYEGTIRIRGRGNSTWGLPKKPYRIKLDSKSEILGMDKAKDWVLLANYSDKTLMRNKLALDFAKSLGMEYTSDSVFVDVVINGEVLGNYLLCEQVEVGSSRVDITELEGTETDDSLITGGYLLEIDSRKDEDTWFDTNKGVSVTFKSPKLPNEKQLNYVKTYINDMEEALYSGGVNSKGKHYSEYIDVDSFVNWYLVNEIFKNNDAVLHTSVYLYKDRDEKLCIGPVWDFDISMGNINYNENDNPKGWWIKTASWYSELFKSPEFVDAVQNRYNEIKPQINQLLKNIDSNYEYLQESQKFNFNKWDILNQYVWPNAVVTGSYEGEVKYLKTWINSRIEWINKNIDGIVENTKPIINANDIIIKLGDKFDPLNNVTATDQEDGDLTKSIKIVENTVDYFKIGTYKVVYEVKDSDKTTTKKEISVKVEIDKYSVNSFVTSIYNIALNRIPDKEGFNFWTTMLTTNKISGRDFLRNLLNEPEFKNINLSSKDFVKSMYSIVNGREAEAEGLNFWVGVYENLIKDGNTKYQARHKVLERIINEPEFQNRCNSMKIKY